VEPRSLAAQGTALGLGIGVELAQRGGGGRGTGAGAETGLVGHLVAALMVLLLLLLVVVQVGLLLLQVELLQVVVRRLLLLLLVVRRLLLLLVVQGNGHAGRQIRQEASGTAWRGCMPGPRAAAQGRRDAGPASARSWHPHAATHSGVGRQVEQAGRNGRWSRLPVLMLHGRCHLHLLSDVVGHCGHKCI